MTRFEAQIKSQIKVILIILIEFRMCSAGVQKTTANYGRNGILATPRVLGILAVMGATNCKLSVDKQRRHEP